MYVAEMSDTSDVKPTMMRHI